MFNATIMSTEQLFIVRESYKSIIDDLKKKIERISVEIKKREKIMKLDKKAPQNNKKEVKKSKENKKAAAHVEGLNENATKKQKNIKDTKGTPAPKKGTPAPIKKATAPSKTAKGTTAPKVENAPTVGKLRPDTAKKVALGQRRAARYGHDYIVFENRSEVHLRKYTGVSVFKPFSGKHYGFYVVDANGVNLDKSRDLLKVVNGTPAPKKAVTIKYHDHRDGVEFYTASNGFQVAVFATDDDVIKSLYNKGVVVFKSAAEFDNGEGREFNSQKAALDWLQAAC